MISSSGGVTIGLDAEVQWRHQQAACCFQDFPGGQAETVQFQCYPNLSHFSSLMHLSTASPRFGHGRGPLACVARNFAAKGLGPVQFQGDGNHVYIYIYVMGLHIRWYDSAVGWSRLKRFPREPHDSVVILCAHCVTEAMQIFHAFPCYAHLRYLEWHEHSLRAFSHRQSWPGGFSRFSGLGDGLLRVFGDLLWSSSFAFPNGWPLIQNSWGFCICCDLEHVPDPSFGALPRASGVEVYGCEWFFGASAEGLFHGVNCNEAKQHAQHRYRTSAPWMDWATECNWRICCTACRMTFTNGSGSLQPSIPECSKDR